MTVRYFTTLQLKTASKDYKNYKQNIVVQDEFFNSYKKDGIWPQNSNSPYVQLFLFDNKLNNNCNIF